MQLKKIVIYSLAFLVIGATSGGVLYDTFRGGINSHSYAWEGPQASKEADYYSTVTSSMSPTELKGELHDIVSADFTPVTYDWGTYRKVDEAEGSPYNIRVLYSDILLGNTSTVNSTNTRGWNREHTFPKSRISGPDKTQAESDPHHIFPSCVLINAARGNLRYNEVNGGTQLSNYLGHETENYVGGGYFEPSDAAKGTVARATMYMHVMYGFSVTSNFATAELLMDWNEEFPPSNHEVNRNNVIHGMQGNRNPFIDHPEWVNKVLGEDYVEVSELSVELDKSGSQSITLDTSNIAAGATVTYTSNNPEVATVSSAGEITAHKDGRAIIEVNAVSGSESYTAFCTVKVGDGGDAEGEGNGNGSGGNDNSNDNKTLIITLSVVGGVILVGAGVGLTIFFLKKKK